MKSYVLLLWSILSPLLMLAQAPGDNLPSGKEISLTIIPNPVKGTKIIVKLEGLSNQAYLIRILDNNGNLVAADKFNSPTSTNFKMIELKKSIKGGGRLQLLNEVGRVIAQSKFISID
ncbi:MAG: hypothetical protein HYX40_08930 [Sphingobacteriales bacterium]|nr:hypothetical protein [Sphingobacteriales bacterium]